MIKISPKVLMTARATGKLDHYAVWLFLKRLYRNSCFYNYTIYNLSKKSGLSRNTIKKYVAFFISEGWCRMHGANLIFVSHRHFRTKKKKLITTTIPVLNCTVKGIKYALMAFLVGNHQRRQLHAIKTKLRDRKLRRQRDEISPLVTTTVKAAGRLFRCGRRRANDILLYLQNEGYFKRTRSYKCHLWNICARAYDSLISTGQLRFPHFYSKMRVVEVLPCRYDWLV